MKQLDEPLAIPEVERHPMWTKPKDDADLTDVQRALHTEIARRLTPLDGRQDYEWVVQFCREVYRWSVAEKHRDTLLLLGSISATWALTDRRMNGIIENSHTKRSVKEAAARQQRVMTVMHSEFVSAVTRTAFP